MPRGVRNVIDLGAQLQKIDEKIEKHKQSIITLEAQREEMAIKKQEADMHELSEFMNANSLSAADVLAMLNPAVAASTQSSAGNI